MNVLMNNMMNLKRNLDIYSIPRKNSKNYHLSLDYKFSGEHLKGAPGWSVKNSGIMLHCQHPSSMLMDQEFPVSAETQLLGGLGEDERSTANICTPGTDVDIDDSLAKNTVLIQTQRPITKIIGLTSK